MENISWDELTGTVNWPMLIAEYMDALKACEAYQAAHAETTEIDGAVQLAMTGVVIVWPAVRCAVRDVAILSQPPPRPLVEVILSATRRVRLTLCAQITAGQA